MNVTPSQTIVNVCGGPLHVTLKRGGYLSNLISPLMAYAHSYLQLWKLTFGLESYCNVGMLPGVSWFFYWSAAMRTPNLGTQLGAIMFFCVCRIHRYVFFVMAERTFSKYDASPRRKVIQPQTRVECPPHDESLPITPNVGWISRFCIIRQVGCTLPSSIVIPKYMCKLHVVAINKVCLDEFTSSAQTLATLSTLSTCVELNYIVAVRHHWCDLNNSIRRTQHRKDTLHQNAQCHDCFTRQPCLQQTFVWHNNNASICFWHGHKNSPYVCGKGSYS